MDFMGVSDQVVKFYVQGTVGKNEATKKQPFNFVKFTTSLIITHLISVLVSKVSKNYQNNCE